jgi:hypothetical protein
VQLLRIGKSLGITEIIRRPGSQGGDDESHGNNEEQS